jgi:hypothetical protein
VTSMLVESLKEALMPRSFALIPKKSEAINHKDFRPVNFVSGVVYKIIAKVLANMIRRVVEKIISNPHNSFVKGR